jgi:hypothetical protein
VRQVYVHDGRVTEPEMRVCKWCEVAHEAEDVLFTAYNERVCIECLDAKYGPRREGRWPVVSEPIVRRECINCPAEAAPGQRECVRCYVERKL